MFSPAVSPSEGHRPDKHARFKASLQEDSLKTLCVTDESSLMQTNRPLCNCLAP